MVAKAETPDMYQSITELAHKLTQQITKHKQKIIDQHR
jgi:ribosomal subunit interface protein